MGAHRERTRMAVVLVLVVAAYHSTLAALLSQWSDASATSAARAAVPFLAVLLAAWKWRIDPSEPDIHDREVDYLIGGSFLVAALLIVSALPGASPAAFLTNRLDLVSLPVFVAGVVAVVFGTRTLWRVRSAVWFLFLASPVVYRPFDGVIAAAARGTSARITSVASSLGLAGAIHGNGATLVVGPWRLGPAGLVGAAICAFVALVALALALDGGRVRKLSWIALGVVLAVAVNAAGILAAGAAVHAHAHGLADALTAPVIVYVGAAVAVAVLFLARRAFGLARPAPEIAERRVAVKRHRLSFTVVAFAALVIALLSLQFPSTDVTRHADTPIAARVRVADIRPDATR